MIPLPDLLNDRPHAPRDDDQLVDLLEMAFLGSNESRAIDETLGEAPVRPSSWDPELFVPDLFIEEFVRAHARFEADGKEYLGHVPFLLRVLGRPPTDMATIRFRQGILRELEDDAEVRARVEELYAELVTLVDYIKSSHTLKMLDSTPHRLRVLEQARAVIDLMADGFAGAASGLRRLHEVGEEIRASHDYRTLVALIDYENDFAGVHLDIRLGADGRIRQLEIRDVREARDNRFHHPPWRRWFEFFRLHWRGYSLGFRELANRTIMDTYMQIAPALSSLVQLIGHLEVYFLSRSFAAASRRRGLRTSIPEVEEGATLALEDLFNPLLLPQAMAPVPCTLRSRGPASIFIVTGPNSGGKTRLLQAVGLAQMLGQSGLHVPASAARLPVVGATFASLVYRQTADQLEGRLGTELVRIRTLFQSVGPRSLIILDELCSGTNPSEAVEIVTMVLDLLERLSPVAFITTHFLDLAQDLQRNGAAPSLDFLQVEVDERHESTYQFIPGVAETSLAAGTARRLGVDFEQLSALIEERVDGDGDDGPRGQESGARGRESGARGREGGAHGLDGGGARHRDDAPAGTAGSSHEAPGDGTTPRPGPGTRRDGAVERPDSTPGDAEAIPEGSADGSAEPPA